MSKRFCTSCGNKLEKDTMFCTKCGTKVEIKEEEKVKEEKIKEEEKVKEEKIKEEKTEEKTEEKIETPVVENNKPPKKKKGHKGLIITIICFVLIALIAFLVWFFFIRDDSKTEKEKDEVVDKSDDKETSKKDKDKDKEKTKKEEKEKKKINGYLYELNDGYAWIRESNYYYLVDEDGEVITKIDYRYNIDDPIVIDGYTEILDTIYNTKGVKVLSLDDGYESIKYVGKGFVIVKIKEENYKGTTTKMGIYDLNKKDYNLDPDKNIKDIYYLGEGMFRLHTTSDNYYNDIKVYNTDTLTSFSIGDRFDILFGEYKDGYIVYREINSNEVYLLGKNGVKKLVYSGDRHVNLGQYNSGLVYIKDAFYDINGEKVIDLKDEGVIGTPEFVNGYALIYFGTGYFTIMSKDTKEYNFDPIQYTKMGRVYGGDYNIGVYENQNKISKSGYILVKTNGDEKRWAVMDVNGNLGYKLPVGVSVFSSITDDGYIAVDGPENDYYVTVKGKEVYIDA